MESSARTWIAASAPVRRAFAAQPLVVIRLGPLAPAGIGIFLTLHRQHRLVVGIRRGGASGLV